MSDYSAYCTGYNAYCEPSRNVSILLLQKQNMEALIKRFKMDLHNCVGFIQDYKKLKAGIRELYTKYVQQLEMVS